ncbi:unnamed protein product [Sphenostylis stenocarpa]|uniref:Uncharacterized protein n=1 Tax=Sphenostylis stenocarpa TaxID=92480 RepID=A0AA86T6A4_9FABA|nr:unnamed protein product [Sphenostylis stenocarpa]
MDKVVVQNEIVAASGFKDRLVSRLLFILTPDYRTPLVKLVGAGIAIGLRSQAGPTLLYSSPVGEGKVPSVPEVAEKWKA